MLRVQVRGIRPPATGSRGLGSLPRRYGFRYIDWTRVDSRVLRGSGRQCPEARFYRRCRQCETLGESSRRPHQTAVHTEVEVVSLKHDDRPQTTGKNQRLEPRRPRARLAVWFMPDTIARRITPLINEISVADQ